MSAPAGSTLALGLLAPSVQYRSSDLCREALRVDDKNSTCLLCAQEMSPQIDGSVGTRRFQMRKTAGFWALRKAARKVANR